MSTPTAAPPRGRAQQERELFTRLRAGDPHAREAILERFLPLAHKLARGYHGGDDADDLDQVAAVGLLKAIDRFDVDRGLAFSTFAFPTIVGELKRYFRDYAWSVRVPRRVQELSLRLERASGELAARLGRAPTVAELAEHTGATAEAVLEARQSGSARRAASLDRPFEDDEGRPATGYDVGMEERGFGRVENGVMLDGLLDTLAPREQLIVRLRFGEDLPQSQIALRVGLSQMHVSRLLRDSIERLQEAANGTEA